jgi:hypothetical protein
MQLQHVVHLVAGWQQAQVTAGQLGQQKAVELCMHVIVIATIMHVFKHTFEVCTMMLHH